MAVSAEIVAAHFGLYRPSEITALSVKKVVSSDTVDTLGNPVPGGLCDRAMGTVDFRSKCDTCHLGHGQCPGHLGHLELASPVYNPMTFTMLRDLMLSKCLSCHHFKATDIKMAIMKAKLTLLDTGLLKEALEIPKLFVHAAWRGLGTNMEEEEENNVNDDIDVNIVDIDKYVKDSLAAHDRTQSLWRVQHSHISDVRSAEISQFFKDMKQPRCNRCDAMNDMIRIRGGYKVFLIPRKKGSHESTGVFDEDDAPRDSERYLPPTEVEKHIKLLWQQEGEILRQLFSSVNFHRGSEGQCVASRGCDPSMFFLRILAVPPNRFRPPNVLGGQVVENDQTIRYQNIMKENDWLAKVALSPDLDVDSFIRSLTRLQFRVGQLIDSHSVKDLGVGSSSDAISGIRQILEKKEGLFRMHMMGKRVNFSARSVISPDPNIDTSEIGVPVHFAMRLSYPQPVTAMNVEEMRRAIMNGPNKYPGANYVVDPDGTVINLDNRSDQQRAALAKTLLNLGMGANPAHGNAYGRKVGRHLMDGDILLVNRQPTLHKPSIMAHRAKILPGDRVIRLHYANCSTYNADFDGDEINLHFPQSELARSDGYLIASTEQQYCVPSSGMPIRGLIQDHVVGGVLLTKRGVFLTKHQYMQLVFGACARIHPNHSIEPIQPAILKPVPLWSGKQVITTVLRYVTHPCSELLNLDSKARVKGTAWQTDGSSHEDDVIFRDSALITGVMDRSQFGATAYGLVHAVNELFGPTFSELLLTALGRLFTMFLQMNGFTMGLDDCRVSLNAEKERAKMLSSVEDVGIDVSSKFYEGDKGLRGQVAKRLEKHMIETGTSIDARGAKLDGVYRSALNPIASQVVGMCIPRGQLKPFPRNNLALMTVSGAKGSAVNHSQIACLLGQQDVEGRRVPRMINGKTLPCFLPYDPSPRSGGFVTQRFLTGLELPEYFFHCMAGREGLIDTAVKTSSSGYLQRCLIKHLESVRVHYDSTVRQEDGSIIQFLYGEDGLDATKTAWLDEKRLGFHSSNYRGYLQRLCIADAASRLKEVPRVRKMHSRALKKKCDPVTNLFTPSTTLGSTSEQFYEKCEKFVKDKKNLASFPQDQTDNMRTKDKMRMMMSMHYMHALAQPGESVGLLAAQSVGEPSTQMTLNSVSWDTRFLVNDQGKARVVEIGAFIDNEVSAATMDNRAGVQQRNNDVLWIPLTRPVYVPSPTERGSVEWRKVEAVTRHPVINDDLTSDLVHVRTDGGRQVSATMSESFLKYDATSKKIVRVRGDQLQVGDQVPVTFKCELPSEMVVSEYSIESDKLTLDADTGFVFGLYCANGCCNNDADVIARFTEWLDKQGIKGTTLFDALCGENKRVPEFMYSAPRDCVVGFIDGFYSGHVSFADHSITVSSHSRLLMEGISALLVRLGIYSRHVDNHCVTIQKDIQLFSEIIELTSNANQQHLNAILNKCKSKHDYTTVGNMVMERVMSVDRVQYTDPFVYDFTVEGTRNMIQFDQLGLRDTFHLAGVAEAKVTLGIPRLREILMTASKKLSAPSMIMPLLPGATRQDALTVAARIDRITLNELVDEVVVVESIANEAGAGVFRDYTLKLIFKDRASIESVLSIDWATIRRTIRRRFHPALLRAVTAHIKAGQSDRLAAAKMQEQLMKREAADIRDDESDASDIASDDDDIVAEADGDARSGQRRRMQGAAYYNAQEEDITVTEGVDHADEDDGDGYDGAGREYYREAKYLRNGSCHIVIRVPADIARILMMELFHETAKNTIVRQEEGIERCHIINTTVSDGSERAAVQTDGVNLELAHRLLDDIDVREVTCNSIHDILEVYGVEAARKCLVREVSGVFGMYGINVDHRHLSLISDYCMHEGGYKGFNRHSMHVNPSPWTRMSFEMSSKFLTNAAIYGESDQCLSSSGCIVVGQHAQNGTGSFDVRIPI